MTLNLELPEDVRRRLADKASSAGLDLQSYAQRVLQGEAFSPPLAETLQPIRDAFKASGMTEEQLTEELEIAKRALSFDQHKVADILTPRKSIKTILADDTVGPILIDELHKAGQKCILVRDKPKGAIVGTLEFKQLGLDSRGLVRNIMSPTVYYLHENDSLADALHAFFITNQPVFVVINSFEEYVGLISVEDMLQQLLGHVPGDDFDQYADPAAVAARHPKKPPKAPETPEEVL